MSAVNQDIIKKFCELTSNVKKAIIFMHVNPDGDAVGSALALSIAFKQCGIDAKVVVPNAVPGNLQWMPNFECISASLPVDEIRKMCNETDIVIAVDFSNFSRIDKYAKVIEECGKKTILIDHHTNPIQNVDLLISDTNVSSTCEIIFELLQKVGFQLTTEIATCIYVGIITDTGNFNYNSNNVETFENVIELLKLGIDKDNITNLVYKNLPVEQVQLLGHILFQRMVVMPQKNVAYIYMTLKDQHKFFYQPGNSDNFVHYPLSIDTVRLSAFFVENKKFIRVSFRSKGDFDVNEFARKYFHGGGHKNASGGKRTEPLKTVIEDFEKIVLKYIDKI